MDFESLREFCLSLPGTSEDFPFDEYTLVFRVGEKIFALTRLNGPPSVNLKCDPERAAVLRELHPAIRPGYHMNKKHWNTLDLDGSLPQSFIQELIRHSYVLVFDSLPKNKKATIQTEN